MGERAEAYMLQDIKDNIWNCMLEKVEKGGYQEDEPIEYEQQTQEQAEQPTRKGRSARRQKPVTETNYETEV